MIPNGLPTLASGGHLPDDGKACVMEYVSRTDVSAKARAAIAEDVLDLYLRAFGLVEDPVEPQMLTYAEAEILAGAR